MNICGRKSIRAPPSQRPFLLFALCSFNFQLPTSPFTSPFILYSAALTQGQTKPATLIYNDILSLDGVSRPMEMTVATLSS